MAATLTQERFTGPDWTFERKFDGIRLIAFKQGDVVRLYSRTRKEKALPGIAAAVAALPVADVILDGEVEWDGHTAYHVFDVIWIDGRDVTRLPLTERRAHARRVAARARRCDRVAELDDAAPWERACAEGWEGVIAKRRDSPYEHKRSQALAQDEVRAVARLRRRRFHRRPGKTRRDSARCSSATSRATISSSPARSARGSTRSS